MEGAAGPLTFTSRAGVRACGGRAVGSMAAAAGGLALGGADGRALQILAMLD